MFFKFGITLHRHINEIPMATNYASLIADLFLVCLGVWEGLRFVIVAHPGIFFYLFCYKRNFKLILLKLLILRPDIWKTFRISTIITLKKYLLTFILINCN